MTWSEVQPGKGSSVDQAIASLITLAKEVVENTSHDIERDLACEDRARLPQIEEQLSYFMLFALHYWWTVNATTDYERRTFSETLGAHLRLLFGHDSDGLAMLEECRERFLAYDEAMRSRGEGGDRLFKLGAVLSEVCGVRDPFLAARSTLLFRLAKEAVESYRDQVRIEEQ